MNAKALRASGERLAKRHRKTIARVVHLLPAPPLIYLLFDVLLPRRLRGRPHGKYRGTHADFQFTFSGMPGRKSWVVEIDDGAVRVVRGERDFPQMVINVSARDFVDLATGHLSETTAMMSGRLAVNGGPALKLKMVMGLFQ